jgi:hypothetical protein
MLYIVLIILLVFVICSTRMEGAKSVTAVDKKTTPSEAIKNIASMYNNDNLITSKLQLGNKWSLSGIGDAYGNDDWLRLMKTDGSKAYYGGLAADKLWTNELAGNVKLSGKLNFSPKCRWTNPAWVPMGAQNLVVYMNRPMGAGRVQCNPTEYLNGMKYENNGNNARINSYCCSIG